MNTIRDAVEIGMTVIRRSIEMCANDSVKTLEDVKYKHGNIGTAGVISDLRVDVLMTIGAISQHANVLSNIETEDKELLELLEREAVFLHKMVDYFKDVLTSIEPLILMCK
tara:strand:- start:533 stop:865 length:333 start_codon:yes stop_codon:yes gene_type:complete